MVGDAKGQDSKIATLFGGLEDFVAVVVTLFSRCRIVVEFICNSGEGNEENVLC